MIAKPRPRRVRCFCGHVSLLEANAGELRFVPWACPGCDRRSALRILADGTVDGGWAPKDLDVMERQVPGIIEGLFGRPAEEVQAFFRDSARNVALRERVHIRSG